MMLTLAIENLLILLTIYPASITASGRLQTRTQRALIQRLSRWSARTGAVGRVAADVGAASEWPNPDRPVFSVAALINLCQHLNLIAPASGQLRPLPSAADWLALPLNQQQHRIHEAVSRVEREDRGGLDSWGPIADTEAPVNDGTDRPMHHPLLLAPDLSLLDGPRTLPGARLTLAGWTEWDDARVCLRLTKASVSRAAAPILATGQDAASVLANLLRRLAEPAPTDAQLLRLHAWCVATTTSKAGDRPPRGNSQSDGVGTMTWRLAALRLVEALAPTVPGIGSPPAEAYEGLEAVANPALNEMVQRWVSAIVNAKGMGGLPIGVDPQLLDEAETALAMGEDLHLRYRSGEAAENWRQVTPLRLEWHRGRVLLVAHCHLRDAERSFRMDRVVELRPANGWPADAGRPL